MARQATQVMLPRVDTDLTHEIFKVTQVGRFAMPSVAHSLTARLVSIMTRVMEHRRESSNSDEPSLQDDDTCPRLQSYKAEF